MKYVLNKILGIACLVFALHSACTLLENGAKYPFQWDGTIALFVVGIELVLIRHHIHKKQ